MPALSYVRAADPPSYARDKADGVLYDVLGLCRGYSRLVMLADVSEVGLPSLLCNRDYR